MKPIPFRNPLGDEFEGGFWSKLEGFSGTFPLYFWKTGLFRGRSYNILYKMLYGQDSRQKPEKPEKQGSQHRPQCGREGRDRSAISLSQEKDADLRRGTTGDHPHYPKGQKENRRGGIFKVGGTRGLLLKRNMGLLT